MVKIVLKRPATVSNKKTQVSKRPSSNEDRDNLAIVTIEDTRTCRNKNNFLKTNRARLPDSIVTMLESLPCHSRTRVVNNLVQKMDDGSYQFNLHHPVVEDSVCATVAYPPLTI